MPKAYIAFEVFKKAYPQKYNSTRVYVHTPEDVIEQPPDTVYDWDYTQDVNSMLARLWAFLQRSVQPAITSDGPTVTFSTSALSFGTIVPQEGSSVMTFTITNNGNEPVNITDVVTTGDFVFLTAA